jgi:hypothetical protein
VKISTHDQVLENVTSIPECARPFKERVVDQHGELEINLESEWISGVRT